MIDAPASSSSRFRLSLLATVFNREQLQSRMAALGATPQIALAGRSNVGKSSLVNALGGRKALAKISATPGKTRSINFYRVDPQGFVLADLPGYGYARCSLRERQSWARLIESYLAECPALKALALLLDCRVPPQALDRDLADFARMKGLPLLPVLTKADKCGQAERSRRQDEWGSLLDGLPPLPVSARDGMGLAELRRAMCRAAAPGALAEPPAGGPETEEAL